MRCRSCIGDRDGEVKYRTRHDVCAECWRIRIVFGDNLSKMTREQFESGQKNGTTQRARMIKILAEIGIDCTTVAGVGDDDDTGAKQ